MNIDFNIRRKERESFLSDEDTEDCIRQLLRAGRVEDALPLIPRALSFRIKNSRGYEEFIDRTNFLRDDLGLKWFLVGSKIYKNLHDIVYADSWSKEIPDWDVLVVNFKTRYSPHSSHGVYQTLNIKYPEGITLVERKDSDREYVSAKFKSDSIKIDFIAASDLGLFPGDQAKKNYAQRVPLTIQGALYHCEEQKLFDYFSLNSILHKRITLNPSSLRFAEYGKEKIGSKIKFYRYDIEANVESIRNGLCECCHKEKAKIGSYYCEKHLPR